MSTAAEWLLEAIERQLDASREVEAAMKAVYRESVEIDDHDLRDSGPARPESNVVRSEPIVGTFARERQHSRGGAAS